MFGDTLNQRFCRHMRDHYRIVWYEYSREGKKIQMIPGMKVTWSAKTVRGIKGYLATFTPDDDTAVMEGLDCQIQRALGSGWSEERILDCTRDIIMKAKKGQVEVNAPFSL